MNLSTTGPFDDVSPGSAADGASQSAALCWRMNKGHVQILLVTSRDTGRWIIPKGWPMVGLSSAAAAAREAWEEAGVEGKVQECPIGTFVYDKLSRTAPALHCKVAVHPLKVQALKLRYPEAHQRRRGWFAATESANLVAEPQLQQMLLRVAEQPELLRGPA